MSEIVLLNEISSMEITRMRYWQYPAAVREMIDDLCERGVVTFDDGVYVLDEKIQRRLTRSGKL